jgi:hypothetical protein
VGLIVPNNRRKIFCEKFGVLTTMTMSFAVFSDIKQSRYRPGVAQRVPGS